MGVHVAPSFQTCLSVEAALSWKDMGLHTMCRLDDRIKLIYFTYKWPLNFTNKDDFYMYGSRVILSRFISCTSVKIGLTMQTGTRW